MKFKTLIIIPMVMGLVSCQQKDDSNKKSNYSKKKISKNYVSKSVSTKRLENETDSKYSEKLTRIGEILINNPVGFSHAHDMFEQALKLNPNNDKALFYSAFTGIVMSQRGVFAKSKKLYDTQEEYDEDLSNLKDRYNYPEIIDFLIGNKNAKKFKNYQQVKEYYQSGVLDSIENASKKLAKISGNVKVILTQFDAKIEWVEYNCRTVVDEDWDYEYEECDWKEKMNGIELGVAEKVTVDKKDIKMLVGGIKGIATYFKLLTAYSIKGQKHITNEVQLREMRKGRTLTDKELHRIVNNYDDYLVLEPAHKMDEIKANIENIVDIGMDLESLNNRYCNSSLRRDNLISEICFDKGARKSMQKALDYLAGPKEYLLGYDEDYDEVNIMVDLSAILTNPIQDIKSLMPDKYDRQGKSKWTVEPKLNGLFPNNDFLEKTGRVDDSNDY